MTEKRFTFTQDTLAKADVFDGNEFVCCTLSVWVEQLVDLLNSLTDENEQLKQEIMEWKEKYYETEEIVINEYSSNISKDMAELQKEVYGDVE